MTKWSELDTAAKNRLIAETMGYTVYHYDKSYKENCYYQLLDRHNDVVVYAPHYRTGERKTEAESWADIPRFCEDDTAARLLEDEIEHRDPTPEPDKFALDKEGLRREYIKQLGRLLFNTLPNGTSSMGWAFLRATPDQRAHAFALAVKAVEE